MLKAGRLKQVLQSLRSGEVEVADVPAPALRSGHLLVRTRRTLISAGTERMLLDFGRAGLVGKVRQQPDKVRQVLDKARTDGIAPTLDAVRSKLDQPIALGYCNVGEVIEVGRGVTGYAVGDTVASNGKHAEVVAVPVNLAAPVPAGVDDDAAAFTVLAAIGLQGVRLAAPTLGETFVVAGLGLVGQLTVQLLRANGCRVIGIDVNPARLALAEAYGARSIDLSGGADPVAAAEAMTRGQGVDGVLVTAATKSSEPIHQSAQMCRKRGRIVLVGVTGLELSRADFYEKELNFQVSCSYGPGRYDPNYEDKGLDYPIGFVRWTEARNFEAVLDMMADGRLSVSELVTHRFALDDAVQAYEAISGPSLGVLIDYPALPRADLRATTVAVPAARKGGARAAEGPVSVTLVGSGNYATGVLIPAFAAGGARLDQVVSGAGVSGLHAARKFGFARTTTDADAAIADPASTAVVVATRHDSHAGFVLKAIEAGKHVFVEKPLALKDEDIDAIAAALAAAEAPPVLTVGFNRRFAPLVVRMKSLLATLSGPKAMTMTVNAGAIPADHWTQDMETGGGRIAGEACHFIDLLRHLAGAPIVESAIHTMDAPCGDTATITLTFADGSLGTVHYFANGTKAVPKERLEVFASGRVLQLDNFRRLTGHGFKDFRSDKSAQDKGQKGLVVAFLAAAGGEADAPIPLEEILEISRVTVELAKGGA